MTGKLHVLGYAKTGREFEVMDAMTAEGIECWRGEKITFERKGRTIRTAEMVVGPALPNYVFFKCDISSLHKALSVKNLSPTVKFMHSREVAVFEDFANMLDRRAADARRIEGNRAAIAEYKKGDNLELLRGPFEGMLATFKSIVQMPHDKYPTIIADLEIFGRTTQIKVDPLDARPPR